MEIKIQFRGRVFSICFGRKTKWFQSKYWFCVTEEYYFGNEIIYARFLNKF
jgi:hypothetical protein